MTKVNILDVSIDRITIDKAVEQIDDYIMNSNNKGKMVVTPNSEMTEMAARDSQFKQVLNEADLSLPDGAGVVLASKLMGSPLPERVAGIDVVNRLLKQGNSKNSKGYRVFFLGGSPGVAEDAKQQVKSHYPNITIDTHHGYLDEDLENAVIDQISNGSYDLLLVGMGVPRQEYWVKNNLSSLNVSCVMCVGGSFDVLSGNVKRAPKVMQKMYFEWLYRLFQNPKRYKRLLSLPVFLAKVLYNCSIYKKK